MKKSVFDFQFTRFFILSISSLLKPEDPETLIDCVLLLAFWFYI
jgi:hypothetical protein